MTDWTGLVICTSSESGNRKCDSDTSNLELILKGNKFEFRKVDVAAPDNLAYKTEMFEKSQERRLPQLFLNGEFKGFFEVIEDANEEGELKGLLAGA